MVFHSPALVFSGVNSGAENKTVRLKQPLPHAGREVAWRSVECIVSINNIAGKSAGIECFSIFLLYSCVEFSAPLAGCKTQPELTVQLSGLNPPPASQHE